MKVQRSSVLIVALVAGSLGPATHAQQSAAKLHDPLPDALGPKVEGLLATLLYKQRKIGVSGAVRYNPDPSTSFWGSAMKTSVTRIDVGKVYQLDVEFTVPNVDHQNDLIQVYGGRFQNETRSDQYSLPSVVGNWKPGDMVTFTALVAKDRSDASNGWSLRFCVGDASRCSPGPNLLAGAPSTGPSMPTAPRAL
jgi:hypothetical protein